MTGLRVGDRSRCLHCGGRIALIHHPRVISLTAAVWVHTGVLRRLVSNHPAKGPTR